MSSAAGSSSTVGLSRLTAAGLLAALVVVWGVNWPIMKVGLQLIPPFWFAALRMAMGAATLFAVLAVQGRLKLPPKGDLPVVLSAGLLQMAGFLALANLALLTIPAGRSSVLAYTTPLWVTPLAVFLLGERLTRLRLVGLALGLGGLLVLFNPLHFPWHDGRALTANLLLLVGAVGWAISIVHLRGHRWQSSVLEIVPWQMLVALVPLTVLALAFDGLPRLEPSLDLLWILAYNGPLATGFCYWVAVSLSKSLPSVTVSLGFLGVPVTGVLAATLALGESLPISLVAGGLLILGGLTLVTLSQAEGPRR